MPAKSQHASAHRHPELSEVHDSVAHNSVGRAGRFLSEVGLLTFGILSPLALIVSLVGMAYEPREPARQGILLSLLGLGLLIGASLVVMMLLWLLG